MITTEPPGTSSNPALSAPVLKRILTLACLALMLCAVPAVAAAQVQPTNWHLTWSDEFNAPNGSPPDPEKWNIVTGGKGFGNNELETYTAVPPTSQQKDGNLVITAQKEDLIGPDGVPRHYTSARLNTKTTSPKNTAASKPASSSPPAKASGPPSGCSATTTKPTTGPTAARSTSSKPSARPTPCTAPSTAPATAAPKALRPNFVLPAGQQVDTAFHLYAVEWSPDDIKFFLDDHLIVERTPADLPPGTHWVYDHPFYVLLNFAVGGNWPGDPDDTTKFPQQMLVDYVRVYSRNPPSQKT